MITQITPVLENKRVLIKHIYYSDSSHAASGIIQDVTEKYFSILWDNNKCRSLTWLMIDDYELIEILRERGTHGCSK